MTFNVGDFVVSKNYPDPSASFFYVGIVTGLLSSKIVKIIWCATHENNRLLSENSTEIGNILRYSGPIPQPLQDKYPQYCGTKEEQVINKIKQLENKWKAQQAGKHALLNTLAVPDVAPEITSVSGQTVTNTVSDVDFTRLEVPQLTTSEIERLRQQWIREWQTYTPPGRFRLSSQECVLPGSSNMV